MLRFDEDTGKYFMVQGSSQVLCDSRGSPIKEFDPALTGRYNFDQRCALDSQIQTPSSLKTSFKRVYSPQNFLLEGYT